MIDTNLTHLNISLIEPSPPWWTPLANPATWLPLLVVLIGAYATYFYANQLSDRKNQYELKVKVYFELLDTVYLLKSANESINAYLEDKPDFKDITSEILKPSKDKVIEYREILRSLSQIAAKLQVVSSRDVFEAYLEFYRDSIEPEEDSKIFTDKLVKLTQAIRKDLMKGNEPLFHIPQTKEKNRGYSGK